VTPNEVLPTAAGFPLRDSVSRLAPSQIVELWEMGHGRDDVIALWVGEGDLPTPKFIMDRAHEALLAGNCFYSAKRGLPVLRHALVAYHQRHFGVALDSERVTVTASGMNAIMMALQATLSQGDNMVTLTPCWPNIFGAAAILGVETRSVPFGKGPDGGQKLDLDALFAACDDKTRAIFVVSPSNPTGWVIDPAEQQAILAFCRTRGIWLLADEVYHRFVYDRAVAPSFLEIAEPDDPLLVVNSFSKTWAMTGWRMGWLIHPVQLGPLIDSLIEYNTSGTQSFIHLACVAALEDGEAFVQENVARSARGGALVYEALRQLPNVRIAPPQGAFYSFFAVEGLRDSLAFCKDLLERSQVGLAPGSAFGAGGEGHIRLCFATSEERLAEALERLRGYLATRP